jgi:hypothetical protein
MTQADQDRAHALVDALCGRPDEAANRAAEVVHAPAAALTWLRAVTRTYAPTVRLRAAAARLRCGQDQRNPYLVLINIAATAYADLHTRSSPPS